MTSARGVWLVLGAALLWGTTGTTQELAPGDPVPLAVGAVRVVFGGAALVLLAAARRQFRAGWPRVPTAIVMGSVALAQLAFFSSVARTGVAVGTIVTIGSAPVMAGVLALLARGEWPERRWYAATVLAVAGCGLLALSGGDVEVDPFGIGLALLAGTGYAAYTVASKQLLEHQHPGAVVAVAFGGAGVLLLPLLATQDLSWLSSPGGALAGAHLSLITVGLGYTLFGRGLALVPSGTAVTLSLAEPLTAAALGVAVLGERLNVRSLLGIVLLFCGLAYLAAGARPARREIAVTPETPVR